MALNKRLYRLLRASSLSHAAATALSDPAEAARLAPAGASLAASAAAGGAGVVGKGFRIPAGSLDIWRAARAASGATRCEVVGFGDSLTYGQGPTAGLYSWLQRLRERSVAAGFTDGGRGFNAQGAEGFDTPLINYGSEVNPVSSRTGFAAADGYGLAGALVSNTAADTVTYRVIGTHARLWWSRFNQGGRFSYAVNGGAAVTVNSGFLEAPPTSPVTYGLWSPDYIYLTASDGMTSGTNVIVVTNLGGNPVTAPVLSTTGSTQIGAGNVPVGTHYYVATAVNGAQETLKSNVLTVVTTGSPQSVNVSLNGGGWTGNFNLYRSDSSSAGPFGLVGTLTGVQSFVNYPSFTDNTASPGAQNPPTVSTYTGLNPTYLTVHSAIEALNAAGIVWHNIGLPGADSYSFFDTADAVNNATALAHLGLQWGTGSNGIAVGTSPELLPHASDSGADLPLVRATCRKPSLVIVAFGTNDIQHSDGGGGVAAPTGVDGGVGIGSGLGAGTYYYKVARVSLRVGATGPVSTASAGVAITAGHQALVTMPFVGSGNNVLPVWDVYRATTSGGTYGFVGQVIGTQAVFVDNVTTTAGPLNSSGLTEPPQIDTSRTMESMGLAVQLARNAGADVLFVLPTVVDMTNSRLLAAAFKAAIVSIAEAFSVPWVDWDVAMGPTPLRTGLLYGAVDGNPHELIAAKQAQGDFLWDKVLSL